MAKKTKTLEELTEETINDHVNEALRPVNRPYLLDSVLAFAYKYVPGSIQDTHTQKQFMNYWTNRFLEHVSYGQRHPVVDAQTGRPVHPLFVEDAAWIEAAEIVEGVTPEYRFPNHWELMEYATRATFYEVLKERGANENTNTTPR
jgi:hypothetical protein